MAEKPNKNLIIGVVAGVVVIIAIIVGIVIAKGNGDDAIGGDGDTGTEQVEGANDLDLSMIDVSVDYGDYDTMFELSKAIQNGEKTGRVVQIDGVVSHPMSKYSVGEEDEGGKVVGTEFVIEGVSESQYPEDGTHVVITGEVIEKEPLYFVIKTTPDYIEIVDDTVEEEFVDIDAEESEEE